MSVLEEKIKELELDLQCEKSITKELSNRILKAIEYVENDLQSFLYSIEYKTLLKILEGKDKE